jgi:hypothetical protein
MKTLFAVAAALAILAQAGCCWPFREGGHRRSQGWSDGSRPAPQRYADRGRP